MYAFNVKRYQLSLAGPNVRLDDTFYDIVAKAERDGTPTGGEFRQMLQELLADRFKNGPELRQSAPDADSMGRVWIKRGLPAPRSRSQRYQHFHGSSGTAWPEAGAAKGRG